MSHHENTYYNILGLRRDATTAQVEAAFLRAQARSGSTSGTEYLTHAYEVLRDPQRRRTYDQLLGQLESALTVEVQASATELPLLDEPQIVYLLVELRPRQAVIRGRLPLNLCVVVDRSTSMRGARLARVQEALQMLLGHMAGSDIVAVVSFSDRAEVLLPAVPLAAQTGAVANLQALEASGGTEIYQGLLAGVTQLRQNVGPEVNSQLILLTDGRTYGDQQQCLQLAAAAAGEGITWHAFGLGADWDDAFLDALVAPSGGLAEHIETPQEILAALDQRLQGLGLTFARDVRLSTDFPPAVHVRDVFRLTPFAQLLPAASAELALGNLEGGAPLKFLLVLEVATQPIPVRIGLDLALHADIPGQGRQAYGQTCELVLSATAAQPSVPTAVLQAARLYTLCRLNERAWQEAEAGQPALAAQSMGHMATRLLEIDEPALARQATREAQQLARSGELSEEGRKRLKYGTRALTRKDLRLEGDEPL